MHEEDKLDEARYFFSKMAISLDAPKAFRFELSAFLSAARSVLQYALYEAKAKRGGQVWYDTHVASSAEIHFFRDKRNISIHSKPVVPKTDVTISLTEVVVLSDFASIDVLVDDEALVPESAASSPLPMAPPAQAGLPSSTYTYTFPDWTGTEDVVLLCSKYLGALQTLVQDGHARGYLT
jgi:hypothetical protein